MGLFKKLKADEECLNRGTIRQCAEECSGSKNDCGHYELLDLKEEDRKMRRREMYEDEKLGIWY